MFDYFHYFASKPDLPDASSILQQEYIYQFETFDKETAIQIGHKIIENATAYEKPVGVRIILDNNILFEELDSTLGQDSLDWLSRKEKVVNETHHSSYYTFLDNITSHKNDHMIMDESYGICGGGFPLLINHQVRGTITCTGLRPQEDHGCVVDAIKEYIENK